MCKKKKRLSLQETRSYDTSIHDILIIRVYELHAILSVTVQIKQLAHEAHSKSYTGSEEITLENFRKTRHAYFKKKSIH